MSENKSAEELFRNELISGAEEYRAQVHAEVEGELSRRLAEYESELRAELKEKSALAKREIDAREERRLSGGKLEAKRSLLETRKNLALTVAEDAEKLLISHTLSPDYAKTLARLLKKGLLAVNADGTAAVQLRPEDMKFADTLKKSAGGIALTFTEGGFVLGGLVVDCEGRKRRADLSFDSALEDMRDRISEMTSFGVEG